MIDAVAQPSKALCWELVHRLHRLAKRTGVPAAVSRVGLNEAGNAYPTDHLEDYVSAQVGDLLKLEEEALAALDHTLQILKDQYSEDYAEATKDCLRKVVLYLMALRHVYLDGEHYQKMEVCKRDVLRKLRVIGGFLQRC